MKEQINRSLEAAKDFKDLAQLEKNVRDRVDFDDEIADAFKRRAKTIAQAQQTLGLPASDRKRPALRSTPVHVYTERLLDWLSKRAATFDGYIEPYSHNEAADALGMDMKTQQSRVYGMVQSRIDFACYRSGLPPLSLTADKWFREAWHREDRSWDFPRESMQRAAQQFRWKSSDFSRVRTEALRLSGQAYKLWKEEYRENQTAVRKWAELEF